MIHYFDIEEIFLIVFVILLIITCIGIITYAIKVDAKYEYECITIDGEKITCDSIDRSESGLLGTRDGTTYMIKQYTRILKKGVENGQ